MQGLYLKDFDDIFRKKGYFYENTPFNFVKYAMRSFDNHISVVVVCDNRFNDIAANTNLDYIRSIVARNIIIPAGYKAHYLMVVLNRYKDKDIKGNNTVAVNTTKGDFTHSLVDKELKTELEIVREIMEVQSMCNENWINRFGGVFQLPHKVRITYFLMAVCVIMYLLFSKNNNALCRSSDVFTSHEYYRLFTYMFLHANIVHLIGNLLGLYVVGHLVEAKIGGLKTAALFVISGIYGGILSYLFNPNISSVGSSGAICGLLGVLLVSTFTYPAWQRKEATFKVLCYIFIVIVSGFFISSTDNWCHLGGLAGGLIFSSIFTLCDQIEKNMGIVDNQKKYKEYFSKQIN